MIHANKKLIRGKNRVGGTMAHHHTLLQTHPSYKRNRLQIEKFTQLDIKKQKGFRTLRRQITRIPVVVHVMYNTQKQNISDKQIHSQIDVLNKDFRKLNDDINKIPTEVFAIKAADALIEFELAVRDPKGKPTNGITRTKTSKKIFGYDEIKSKKCGGMNAWPSNRYLNLWVGNIEPGLLGYAQFPGGPKETDGVVVTYKAFGTMGTAINGYDKGRTATHEIGHWLNLLHIWGDDNGRCDGSDNIADTPNQSGPNMGIPKYPHVSCNNKPNGDLFMNYMDYTEDKGMYMFTYGQVARMQATLNGPRKKLLKSRGLEVVVVSGIKPNNYCKLGAEFEKNNKTVFDGVSWVLKK